MLGVLLQLLRHMLPELFAIPVLSTGCHNPEIGWQFASGMDLPQGWQKQSAGEISGCPKQ